MTWISERPITAEATAELTDGHDQPGTELAPGIRIERRDLLWLPPIAAAALLFGHSRRLWARAETASTGPTMEGKGPTQGSLSWEDFLKQSLPVAKELVRDRSDRGYDAYLWQIASFAVRLESAPRSRLGAFGGLKPKVEFGPSFRGTPFFIIQWRMEPGAILPAHCHPQASVCTVGLEGEARVRHFELHGEAPAFDSGSARSFLIRETHEQIIATRRISTLSPTRDNIHYFEAGQEGARGLDITTMYGGKGNFSFVAFDPEKPRDSKLRLYEAAWTGQNPKA